MRAGAAGLRLRPSAPADLERVVALEADPDVCPWIDPWPLARHRAFLGAAGGAHRIAELHGEALGFLILDRLHHPGRSIELVRMALSRRGGGLGGALLDAAMAEAFDGYGAHRLWLDVMPGNQRARRLYRSRGFVEEGVMRDALLTPAGYTDLVLMSILEAEYAGRVGDA